MKGQKSPEPKAVTTSSRALEYYSIKTLEPIIFFFRSYFNWNAIFDPVLKLPVFRICGKKLVHRTDVTVEMVKLMSTKGSKWN